MNDNKPNIKHVYDSPFMGGNTAETSNVVVIGRAGSGKTGLCFMQQVMMGIQQYGVSTDAVRDGVSVTSRSPSDDEANK
ncbi:TPA: hypothetical protein KUM96_004537 [Serratia marcescens]|nr:hypothetical protein [Serratia marcescens]